MTKLVGEAAMTKTPEPIKGDEAEAAEKRLDALHRRFRAVSDSLDQARRTRAAGGWALAPFEAVILVALSAFIVWGVGRAFGSW